MRQYPRQSIFSNELSAGASIQRRLFILVHSAPFCRLSDITYLAESLYYKMVIAIFAPLFFYVSLPFSPGGGSHEKAIAGFLENAQNCAELAERAPDEPTHKRYKRMEATWRALAEEQDWLDGEVSPENRLMEKENRRPCGTGLLNCPWQPDRPTIRQKNDYRSSSGCTHLYGVTSCRSVSLIIRTGGA